MPRILLLVVLLSLLAPVPLRAEPPQEEDIVYKTLPSGEALHVLVNYPEAWTAEDKRPAMVFFHGGGWTQGTYRSFGRQTDYLTARGLVMFRVQYRLLSGDGPTIPTVCTLDARSAMRFIRANAARFGIDPERIVSCGGSAGGHLAAMVAVEKTLDDPQDDLGVSPKPQAMVLMNPGLDLVMEAELRGISLPPSQAEKLRMVSPQQHLAKDTPPSVIFFGDQDRLLPHGTNFAARAKRLGLRADLHIYPGVGHTFWRRTHFEEEVLYVMDEFLVSLGYLEGVPTLDRPSAVDLKEGVALEEKRMREAPDVDNY